MNWISSLIKFEKDYINYLSEPLLNSIVSIVSFGPSSDLKKNIMKYFNDFTNIYWQVILYSNKNAEKLFSVLDIELNPMTKCINRRYLRKVNLLSDIFQEPDQ